MPEKEVTEKILKYSNAKKATKKAAGQAVVNVALDMEMGQ